MEDCPEESVADQMVTMVGLARDVADALASVRNDARVGDRRVHLAILKLLICLDGNNLDSLTVVEEALDGFPLQAEGMERLLDTENLG